MYSPYITHLVFTGKKFLYSAIKNEYKAHVSRVKSLRSVDSIILQTTFYWWCFCYLNKIGDGGMKNQTLYSVRQLLRLRCHARLHLISRSPCGLRIPHYYVFTRRLCWGCSQNTLLQFSQTLKQLKYYCF